MKDGYGREINYLRLSVTDRCNLRCRYCMPESGIVLRSHSDMLSEEEMILAVKICAGLGIKKVRITGGEPLVRKGIVNICRGIHGIEGIEKLCITTNGILLPQFAKDLVQAGVSCINISLDTLDSEKYRKITRIGSLDSALEGLEAALSAGFEKIKINAVLIGGFNDDEIPDLAALTLRYPVDVRFIELMPMTDNPDFAPSSYTGTQEVLKRLSLSPETGSTDGVAVNYRLPGAHGSIGLISPLSHEFCHSCNRIRITADGKVKPCLHTGQEFSIKGCSEQEMQETIKCAVLAKPPCHGKLSAYSKSMAGRSMFQIGG